MADRIDNSEDVIDSRNIIARIEELETEIETEHTDDELDAVLDMKAELETLMAFMDQMKGYGGDEQWRGDWYPVTLVRDSYFRDYAEELVTDCGYISKDLPGWIAIDWDATARNVRMDYSSVELDGITYWYR